MSDDKLIVEPPLYLIGKMYSCWRCQAKMPVVSVLAPKVRDSWEQVSVLSGITEMPEEVVAYIQGRVPTFKLKYSKTVGQEYFASTCPKCGMLSGDFHLHSEPGAPFFPTTEEEAASLYMTEIPISGSIKVQAAPAVGCGELILENARRIA
jgi:hypothetical protein